MYNGGVKLLIRWWTNLTERFSGLLRDNTIQYARVKNSHTPKYKNVIMNARTSGVTMNNNHRREVISCEQAKKKEA